MKSDDWKEKRRKSFLWSLFLKRKECMACKKNWDTKKYRPYCLTCFKSINKEINLMVDDGPFGNKLVNPETAREDLQTNHLQQYTFGNEKLHPLFKNPQRRP